MDLTLRGLLALALESMSDPRGVARRVIALNLPPQERWSALALMSLAWTLLTHLTFALGPPAFQAAYGGLLENPIVVAVIQGLFLLCGTAAIHRIGRARGGTGSLPATVSLVAWLLFVWLLIVTAELVASVLLPPLGAFVGIAGILLFFWLMTQSVMELHGFRSAIGTFAAIVLGMIGLMFVLGLVLTPFIPIPQGA